MKGFLNSFMEEHQDWEQPYLDKLSRLFESTIDRIYKAVGKDAFRLPSNSNLIVSFFDAFMIAVARNEKTTSEIIRQAHIKLQKEEKFTSIISSQTTSKNSVSERIRLAKEALNVPSS